MYVGTLNHKALKNHHNEISTSIFYRNTSRYHRHIDTHRSITNGHRLLKILDMKINFRNGIYVGALISLLTSGLGFLKVQTMVDKAEHVASMDLSQLEYYNLNGNEVSLADYADKHLLVNFWATWCAPCIGEFPLLNETYGLVKENITFIMVSYESIDKIKKFEQRNEYDFIFLKSSNFIMEGISTVPQSFIFDKDGNTVHHHATIFKGSAQGLADSLKQWLVIE